MQQAQWASYPSLYLTNIDANGNPRQLVKTLSHTAVTIARLVLYSLCAYLLIQSYPGYPNTFGQRGFISCSDKRNCSDNPNETFLAIYILYNMKSMYEGRA